MNTFTKKSLLICFASLLLLAACTKDKMITQENLYIDTDLQPYFESFQEEANARGVTIDFSTILIEGYVQNITDSNVIGQCSYAENSNQPRKLLVDENYWYIASDLEKEFLVFHELGHCYLNRIHLDTQDSNGFCISIMNSGLGNCRMQYNKNTRPDYLDELFSK